MRRLVGYALFLSPILTLLPLLVAVIAAEWRSGNPAPAIGVGGAVVLLVAMFAGIHLIDSDGG